MRAGRRGAQTDRPPRSGPRRSSGGDPSLQRRQQLRDGKPAREMGSRGRSSGPGLCVTSSLSRRRGDAVRKVTGVRERQEKPEGWEAGSRFLLLVLSPQRAKSPGVMGAARPGTRGAGARGVSKLRK